MHGTQLGKVVKTNSSPTTNDQQPWFTSKFDNPPPPLPSPNFPPAPCPFFPPSLPPSLLISSPPSLFLSVPPSNEICVRKKSSHFLTFFIGRQHTGTGHRVKHRRTRKKLHSSLFSSFPACLHIPPPPPPCNLRSPVQSSETLPAGTIPLDNLIQK